jgi:hypothetical protein
MRAHRGIRILLHSFALALFILAIFARNITGAPNAQIAFSEAIYEKTIQGQSATSIELASDPEGGLFQSDDGDASMLSEDEDRTQYRKTLCPDCPLVYGSIREFSEVTFENFNFVEAIFFTSAPSTLHANAPPKADSSTHAFSHFYFEGASQLELPNDNKCGWGIGFDRLRT